jgi:hypothetical protein
MKLSGSTHMTILFSFALVFVVIYLYYTINDVKRMHEDIKKVQTEVQSLTTTVNKLNTDVVEVQKMGADVGKVFNMNEMLSQELNSLFNGPQFVQLDPSTIVQKACQGDICVVPTTTPVQQSNEDDDADSVDTTDMKKMLNDDVSEDGKIEEVSKEEVAPVAEPVVEKKKTTTRKKN